MTVIDLAERRASRSRPLMCACGSTWFSLVVDDAQLGDDTPGAVAVAADGSIFGYAGKFRCRDCGNDFKP
ncbi:MAG: hypothetical protein KGL39_23095 [Patescibacteria group bacterium]|nr:hypothetical protein [Patescibacteria group bacterium]